MKGDVTVRIGMGDDAIERPKKHLVLTLQGQICEPCNNDWLSQLESATQPILAPMAVEARTIELDPAAQRVLATWAVKTALLLELAIRQRHPDRKVVGYDPPKAELAWLFAHREPPPRARVWIGAFNARNTIALRHEAANLTAVGKDGVEIPAHLTTFSVGYVAFQVFTVDFVQAVHSEAAQFPDPPGDYAKLLIPIWPQPLIPTPVMWPGEHKFADEHWQMMASWPHRAFQRPAV